MKILMLSYWSCPLIRLGILSAGGMNVYLSQLSRHLSLLGHSVDIYTRIHQERDEKVFNLSKSVQIIHLNSKLQNHYQNIKLFTQRVFDYCQSNKLNYDILHSHYFYSGLIGLQLKKKLNLPVIQTFHTLSEEKKVYAGIIDEKRSVKEKYIIDNVEAVIASTELEKNDLIKLYRADKNKIFVVNPGVDHKLFKPIQKSKARKKIGIKDDKLTLLFVGRIDPIKGISFLIEAVTNLITKYPIFKKRLQVLLIGGDIQSNFFWHHPEVRKIKKLIKNKNLECCVKFHGSKQYNQLPWYYSAADIVVLPSIYETFGLVILEAMACGACVVASKVGGLKYLFQDKISGRFFKSGDVDSLCMILRELIESREKREILGKNAYRASYKFCWNLQAKKILQVYNIFT